MNNFLVLTTGKSPLSCAWLSTLSVLVKFIAMRHEYFPGKFLQNAALAMSYK